VTDTLDRRGDDRPAEASIPAMEPLRLLPVYDAPLPGPDDNAALALNAPLVADWLVRFLRHEVHTRRGFSKAVLGLSGGVDSALAAALCARALGPENVRGIRMPYRTSARESLDHATLVADALGIETETIEITAAADGYLSTQPTADGRRRGNVFARLRMIVLFDVGARDGSLPIGTGNKTERLFGYYTWHADDAPPVNPLGDLFKTQVWQLARHLGVPEEVVGKPASADLIVGQTDEIDFGITYAKADRILHYLLQGYPDDDLVARGFDPAEVALVRSKVEGTHWKRHLPTFAMISGTSINDSYLRPVDY